MKLMNCQAVLSSVTMGMLLVGALAVTHAAESQPFDPNDPSSVQREYERINNDYRSDPVRLADELNRFAERLAHAAGRDAEAALEVRQRLLKRYGPAGNVTEYLPTHDSPGRIIDHDAWRSMIETDGEVTMITFFLDKVRYRGVIPTDLRVQLRRKGKDPEEEEALARGLPLPNAFRVSLAYATEKGDVFVVRLSIPTSERALYVLDVSAAIEAGWSTRSTLAIQ